MSSKQEFKERQKNSINNTSDINSVSNTETETCPISDSIIKSAETLSSVNIIKDEITKLGLNPEEKNYIENYVTPLLNTLYLLSATSLALASSAGHLAVSINTSSKSSKIKDTEKLVYDINEQCEDIYDVLKKRIDVLL
ncbi:hypothetical protein JOC70_003235 [Clostridium pascui]|uniref:hypothetical protein n=1 Tax=Clostridium pascui TaxID=46609 RepID=UPI001959CE8E|nr:hypothetical protein [Clostridium pascui]MBM7871725.1 hypothetical protein [Clostridium pascui]